MASEVCKSAVLENTDVVWRLTKERRHLFDRHTLEEAQDDYLLAIWLELPKRVPHCFSISMQKCHALWVIRRCCDGFHRKFRQTVDSRASLCAHDDVMSDCQQPSDKGCLTLTVPVQGSPSLQEGLLREVLGLSAISGPEVAVPVHAGHVKTVQVAECRRITMDSTAHQVGFVAAVRTGRSCQCCGCPICRAH